MTSQTPCMREPELWFSSDPDDQYEAATACGFCPLREDCKRRVSDEIHGGVWGGVLVGREGKTVVQPKRRDCGICEKPFTVRTAAAKYCSEECRKEADLRSNRGRYNRAAKLTCPVCQNKFQPRSASSTYCKPACRAIAKKRRKEEREVGEARLSVLVSQWEPLRTAS